MKRTTTIFAAAAAFLSLFATTAGANSPDDVLVENSYTKLTRGDYEADLLLLPADMHSALASDPKRLTTLLNNILIAKTLAAQARQEGLDREPKVARLLALEADRILEQLSVQRFDEKSGADFDANKDEYLKKARELYILDKDKYRVPEQVRAAHILFDPKNGGDDAALARAKEARAKLLAGADFTTLAEEVSDEPRAKVSGGELGWFGPGRLDADFTKAAFAMSKPGEISEPLHTRFGYHLIRFEERRPARQMTFDEVKDSILTKMRTAYVKDQREARLNTIRNDPNMKIDQQAVDGLVYRVESEQLAPKPQPAQ